jgi:hypothetical protein
MPRISKITKTRRYRLTKKNPRRAIASINLDLGNVEQQIAVSFPQNSQIINVEIPKEKNPELRTIYLGNVKLAWYLDSKRGFVYDEKGLYCGRFEKHDLKNLFWQIGDLLKVEKNRKG